MSQLQATSTELSPAQTIRSETIDLGVYVDTVAIGFKRSPSLANGQYKPSLAVEISLDSETWYLSGASSSADNDILRVPPGGKVFRYVRVLLTSSSSVPSACTYGTQFVIPDTVLLNHDPDPVSPPVDPSSYTGTFTIEPS